MVSSHLILILSRNDVSVSMGQHIFYWAIVGYILETEISSPYSVEYSVSMVNIASVSIGQSWDGVWRGSHWCLNYITELVGQL